MTVNVDGHAVRAECWDTVQPPYLGKRIFDTAGALLGLVLLMPLLVAVAIFIKLTSPGPIVFRHKRYGYLGEPFRVWKFRTMHVSTDPNDHKQQVKEIVRGDGSLKKLHDRSQLIPCARWLRSAGIDELPQLINVLLGEMSLVGPRPDVVPVEEYEDWQCVRFGVLPGLTGLWQVSGKNKTSFQEMMQLDAHYARNHSFVLDLWIIIRTIPAIMAQVLDKSEH